MMSFATDQKIGSEVPDAIEASRRMDQMYRLQRHIYDATRRYYLLGRDRMIANLRLVDHADVLEIGCGTGRNLVRAARRYPKAHFFGIDISTEMLTSACAALSRHRLIERVSVARGDGATFEAQSLFGIASFDAVFISYSLSMIPDWGGVLQAAARHLKPGGRLHVVDFGQQEQMPGLVRSLLFHWLAIFAVSPRDDLECVLVAMAARSGGSLEFQRPFRGYAQYAVVTLP